MCVCVCVRGGTGGGRGGGGAYLRGEGVAYLLTSLNVSSGMGLSKEFYGVRHSLKSKYTF